MSEISNDAPSLRESPRPRPDQPPALPTQVSPDGREIWDWAARLSEHTQRLQKMRDLRANLFAIGRECGSCDKWMKSRECPRERNVNGMSRGPSMCAPICGQFAESRGAAHLRQKWEAELSVLEAQASASNRKDGSSPNNI